MDIIKRKIETQEYGGQKIFSPELKPSQPSSGSKLHWVLLALGLIALIAGIFFLTQKYLDRKSQERSQDYSYEALVEVVDQRSDDPVVDRRLNLKQGDVLVVFPKGHEWAETEKQTYLILKLKISEEEAAKLVEADIGEVPGGVENGPPATGLVRMRAYRIKTENLKFDPAELGKSQPYEGKVFDEKIIEKKQ